MNRRYSRRGRSRTTRTVKMWLTEEDALEMGLTPLNRKRKTSTPRKAPPKRKAATVAELRNRQIVESPPILDVGLDGSNPNQNQFERNMMNNVEKKVLAPMKGYLDCFDDDDDIGSSRQMGSGPTYSISDSDSDDDISLIRIAQQSQANIPKSQASGSASTSAQAVSSSSQIDEESIIGDIMEQVDNVLTKGTPIEANNSNSEIKDMQSLEDYRKKTEEMLESAAALLDEIKKPAKVEPPAPPKPVTPQGDKVMQINPCPICMESLVGKPATATVCGHIFCKQCITASLKIAKSCPTCRKHLTAKKIHPIYF